MIQGLLGLKVNVACCGKVSFVGEVCALIEVYFFNQFGNHKMQIRISLSMGMAYHIYRHTIHGEQNVGSMVNIEST